MEHDALVFTIFLVFTGAAGLATFALYARQAMLVAYIVLGVLLGPSVLDLVPRPELIADVSNIGIMFLLFLLGLNLHPQKLLQLLRETLVVTGVSSLLFAALGIAVGSVLGLSWTERLVVGAATMFSSTIIGLKLLPTSVLHHRHTGEIIISVLLLQDLIAIVILLLLQALGHGGVPLWDAGRLLLSLPLLIGVAIAVDRFVLDPLMARFDTIQEYLFLLAIGWCLGVAELAVQLGLSHEIGAFIAGVALATSPISTFIAESLKPLRDFFLVLFFFSLGAGFDMQTLPAVLVPALVLAAAALVLKPLVFRLLLQRSGEARHRAMEVGVRLGQISEFSLLIAVLALDLHVIGERASTLIQAATLLTFVASSYFIVLRYPSPMAVDARLRRD